MNTASRRIGRTIVKLTALFSLLTGCAPKPTGPGVSAPLQYPVLLFNDRRVVVRNDEATLTSSTVATGLNYPEFTLIDSGGTQFSVRKVTEFGKKSGWTDMGTSQFRVYLDLKSEGKHGVANVKDLLKKQIAGRVAIGTVSDPTSAIRAVDSVQTLQELIEVCRNSIDIQ